MLEGWVPKFATFTIASIKGLVMIIDARPSGLGNELESWSASDTDAVMTLNSIPEHYLDCHYMAWTEIYST